LPLTGIRVIDLTRILSGPFCTMVLGDLGAEIVKVETPDEGDAVRRQGVIRDGLSWYFASYNRNKRSITLDLKTPAGRAVLARLIEGADVLVDNFRPGVLDAMGFTDERLTALKPDLIRCGICGFGVTGPYRDRPAFDFIAQAMSGFMSVTGSSGEGPMRAGPPISDLIAGLYGALGVVAALHQRSRTARGETVGISLLGGLASMLSFLAADYLASGALPQRTGNDHALVAPYGLFRTADGAVAVAPSNDGVYRKLLRAIDAVDLLDRPEFATNELRRSNRAAINGEIETRLRAQTSAYWIAQLNDAGVPCGPILDMAALFADPQVIDQRIAVDVPHAGHGTVRMLGSPLHFGGAPLAVRLPAPELGADTDAVLTAAGYSAAEIAALHQNKVV
jgi:CoA:oxalate CoA-transferase